MSEDKMKYKKIILFIAIGFILCLLSFKIGNFISDWHDGYVKNKIENVIKLKEKHNDSLDIRLHDQDTMIRYLLLTVQKLQTSLDAQDEKTRSQFIKPKDKNTQYLNHWFDSANRASGIK